LKKLNEFSCNLCKKKLRCKELCPPIEWYANQDEIEPNKEKPIAPEALGVRSFPHWPESLSKEELICLMYFVDQKNQVEIANALYVTQPYVSQTINKFKPIIIETFKKSINISKNK
jgi:hypothetical protein